MHDEWRALAPLGTIPNYLPHSIHAFRPIPGTDAHYVALNAWHLRRMEIVKIQCSPTKIDVVAKGPPTNTVVRAEFSRDATRCFFFGSVASVSWIQLPDSTAHELPNSLGWSVLGCSADGTRVLLGKPDYGPGTVRVFDVDRNVELFQQEVRSALGAVLSSDGRFLLLPESEPGYNHQLIMLRDDGTTETISGGSFWSPKFVLDGKALLVLVLGGGARLLALPSLQLLREWKQYPALPYSNNAHGAFVPVVRAEKKRAEASHELIDIANGTTTPIPGKWRDVYFVKENHVVCTTRENQLAQIDLSNGSVLLWNDGHDGTREAFACSADGRRAALLTNKGVLRVFAVDRSETEWLFECATRDGVTSMVFSPDGMLLYVLNPKAGLLGWDLRSGEEFLRAPELKQRATTLHCSPDGSILLSIGPGMAPRLIYLSERTPRKMNLGKSAITMDALFDSEGRIVTLEQQQQQLKLGWFTREGVLLERQELTLKAPAKAIALVDGKAPNVVVVFEKEVLVWKGELGVAPRLQQVDASLQANRVLGGAALLAVTSSEREGNFEEQISVWDLDEPTLLGTFPAGEFAVLPCVSRDRKRVFWSSFDGMVHCRAR